MLYGHRLDLEALSRASGTSVTSGTSGTSVTGITGLGRTRLISEPIHRLGQSRPGNPTARGWTGGFLAGNPLQQPPHYRMLATTGRPVATRSIRSIRSSTSLPPATPTSPYASCSWLAAAGQANWWPSLRDSFYPPKAVLVAAHTAWDP